MTGSKGALCTECAPWENAPVRKNAPARLLSKVRRGLSTGDPPDCATCPIPRCRKFHILVAHTGSFSPCPARYRRQGPPGVVARRLLPFFLSPFPLFCMHARHPARSPEYVSWWRYRVKHAAQPRPRDHPLTTEDIGAWRRSPCAFAGHGERVVFV